jgi:hypothetical protein
MDLSLTVREKKGNSGDQWFEKMLDSYAKALEGAGRLREANTTLARIAAIRARGVGPR